MRRTRGEPGRGRRMQDRGKISSILQLIVCTSFFASFYETGFPAARCAGQEWRISGLLERISRDGLRLFAALACYGPGSVLPSRKGALMQDDDFTPRLGRPGNMGKTERYLTQVVRATQRAGKRALKGSGRFTGERIGRGAARARVLSSGGRIPRCARAGLSSRPG